MKVVLFALNGSWVHSSLAIRCLRAPLERAGFDVTLIEGTLRDRTAHLLERLYEAHADVYGFSCYIWNLTEMTTLAKDLSALCPDAKILFGGPEVSYAPERFDGEEWLDAVITGEGEDAVVRFCEAVRDGKPFDRLISGGVPDVMRDEGILYRESDATGDILYYESSRGCPYSCAYCLSSATCGVRFKSVAQTLADLEAFEKMGERCKVIKFVDRTFNADPARANAIWQGLLDAKYTKTYHFELCASLLNEESFQILAQFPVGKVQLEFGLQSTNPETLAAVSRHIDPAKVLSAVRRVHEFGNIHVHLDLIAGLPYEGYARFAQSFDDAYGAADLLQLGFLKLLFGTDLRACAERYGYVALSEPPYTVLQSKWIRYEEMQRLSHIAEVLERYLESGKFAHTLGYLDTRMPSPFRFFEGLTDYLRRHDPRPLQKLSQPDAYRLFWEYVRTGETVSAPPAEVLACLQADFTESEHKNPPAFLR